MTLSAHAAELSSIETQRIGALIFKNECASQTACLTSWNKGEEFASLGIGHFIWYPEGTSDQKKHFDESFPELLLWFASKGTVLPHYLADTHGNPWGNKENFEALRNSKKMAQLREFLLRTQPLQAAFMKNRLDHALPRILEYLPLEKHTHIRQQFQYIADSPMGYYALMDYVNFKGEGIKTSERYQGKGWGLLQVLEHMQSTHAGLQAIQEFSHSAVFVLTRRVKLSPVSRHEERWLPGWKKRVQTYKDEAREVLINSGLMRLQCKDCK